MTKNHTEKLQTKFNYYLKNYPKISPSRKVVLFMK